MSSDPVALGMPFETALAASESAGDTAIRVTNLSKCYHIYDRPPDRLKQSIFPRLQRLVGQPPKQYHRDFWALKDVSFEVKKGETVGIVGRNGSGKSTLLQLICGTLTPSAGSVKTNGRVAALLELGSGFNPEFTGRENVYMNGAVLGLTRDEIDARFDAIAAFADIGEFIEHPVKMYSSGMLMRLAFSVIAHVDADTLIIDESLSVGDAAFSRKCMRYLREFMETGSVLFVSHDTSAIRGLCNRAIWLERGKIIADGDPKQVSEQYLKYIYELQQGPSAPLPTTGSAAADVKGATPQRVSVRDIRQDFVNASPYRNDIQIFDMTHNARAFGLGGVELRTAVLADSSGAPMSWVLGGESVELQVHAEAMEHLDRVIVGFALKDRLGQYLFADNTHLTCIDERLSVDQGHKIYAAFRFRMPVLKAGEYSIDIAIADGVQSDHAQQLWIHDALVLRSVSSSVCNGLIGVPMERIELSIS